MDFSEIIAAILAFLSLGLGGWGFWQKRKRKESDLKVSVAQAEKELDDVEDKTDEASEDLVDDVTRPSNDSIVSIAHEWNKEAAARTDSEGDTD